MEFQSVKTVESKVIPGVTFDVRVLGEARKNRVNTKTADALGRMRTLQAEMETIDFPRKDNGELDEDARMSPEVTAQIYRLSDATERITRSEIDPEYFKEGFVTVRGFALNGNTSPSALELLEDGPRELYREIVAAIREASELSLAEKANFESPTTSAAQVAGLTNDTTAASAEISDSTRIESATNSSPA